MVEQRRGREGRAEWSRAEKSGVEKRRIHDLISPAPLMKQCFLPVDALKPRHLHPHRNMQFIRISSCVSSAWIKDERNCKCVRVVASAANVLIMRKHHLWLLLRSLLSSCLPGSAEAYRRFPEACSCNANQM